MRASKLSRLGNVSGSQQLVLGNDLVQLPGAPAEGATKPHILSCAVSFCICSAYPIVYTGSDIGVEVR